MNGDTRHYHNDMHEACRERFREIDKRLDEGDKIFSKHSTDIAVIQTNVSSLIKSMNGLTKALWGICGTMLATFLGFFIWYVQGL